MKKRLMKITAIFAVLLLLVGTCTGCGLKRFVKGIIDKDSRTEAETFSSANMTEEAVEETQTEEAAEEAQAEENAENKPFEELAGGDYSGKVDENGKDSDGIQIPEVGEGETLFIGYGNLPDLGLMKMAVVLSEDKQSIHGITMFHSDFGNKVGGVDVPFSSIQNSMNNTFSLPLKEETLGSSTLKDVHFEGDYIYALVDYTFNVIDINRTGEGDQLIPLGEVEFWLREADK